ncbi:hypothetical protein DL96DRAFT_162450 [Flagelloscypha sp. PMI_526]|nr:hypothetical protein DL96DRAFT_162450 [Flagelloscypha sp. PMI_526]
MGIFSRKPDENSNDVTVVVQDKGESVVSVLRQRFYGRLKGKDRDLSATPKAQVSHKSSRGTLLPNPTPPPPSPLANSFIPERSRHERARTAPAPATSRDKPLPAPVPTATPSPSKTRFAESTLPHRKAADSVTVSLAQRLNELASAHAEGVLSDDDYRMLRQDLFERFSGGGGTAVPTETSVVPTARDSVHGTSGDNRRMSTSSRPNSQFQVDINTVSSSRTSLTSGMSSLFRRGSSSRRTQQSSNDFSAASETGSIVSDSPSKVSNSLTRRLSKVLTRKSSTSSLATDLSQSDAISMTSRRTRPSQSGDRHHIPDHKSISTMHTKSNHSMRRLVSATPPSSFPGKLSSIDSSLATNPYSDDNDKFKSSNDIRKEIAAVEAECRRLMDSFNGLELSLLTKRNRSGPGHGSVTGSEFGSEDGFSTYARPLFGRRFDNSDMMSIHSNTSIGTAFSNARSTHSTAGRKVTRSKTNTSLSNTAALHALLPVSSTSNPSRATSLVRKNSGGSLASGRSRRTGVSKLPTGGNGTVGLGLNLAPPMSTTSHLSGLALGMSSRNGSSSSLNPSSGHLPLPNTASSAGSRVHDDASSFSSVPHIAPSSATRGRAGSLSSQNLLQATEEETIVVEATVQDDMDDIRRRR